MFDKTFVQIPAMTNYNESVIHIYQIIFACVFLPATFECQISGVFSSIAEFSYK